MTLTQYANAAQILPMAWLTQAEFPSKDVVKNAFRIALAELPEGNTYEDNVMRSELQSVIDGTDPPEAAASRRRPFTPQANCTTGS